MDLFRRAIRLFLAVLGAIAGFIVATALFYWRQMVRPPRQPLWATPRDAGLSYEDVEFPARDGLRLSGWFLPADTSPGPAIILVHGWPWNRLGEAADTMLANLSGALPVDLLRFAHSLHGAGYNVLMFDLRNHGQSADGAAVTFGLQESNDLLGAIDFLRQRHGVDQDRLGVVGFSMGANAVLYALPHTTEIRAAVAVQPTSPKLFAKRYAADLLGAAGTPVLSLATALYGAFTHLSLEAIEPVIAVAGAGETPVLYVQGKGDRWGSVSNVAHMASQTPNAVSPLFVDSNHRYGGYLHVIDNPQVAIDFFRPYLMPN
ncbi:MAG: alpha/beta fold hydrolase [Anaerolineae bacterium]|nr:alpha/beta fold hydrolase [Anaerolineae bacterium]